MGLLFGVPVPQNDQNPVSGRGHLRSPLMITLPAGTL